MSRRGLRAVSRFYYLPRHHLCPPLTDLVLGVWPEVQIGECREDQPDAFNMSPFTCAV